MNVVRRLITAVASVVAVCLVGIGLSACSSSGSGSQTQSAAYYPLINGKQAWGPIVNGHATCAYELYPSECDNSGILPQYWFKMPTTAPSNYNSGYDNSTSFTDMLLAMYVWHTMFSPFYASPYYYGHYFPASYRATHTYNTYNTTVVRPFTTRNASVIRQTANSPKASMNVAGKTTRAGTVNPAKLNPQKISPNKLNPVKINSGGGCKFMANSFADSKVKVASFATMRGSGGHGGSSGGGHGGSGGGGSRPKPPAPAKVNTGGGGNKNTGHGGGC